VYHASDEGHTECLALIERYVPAAELAAECTRCLPTQLHWGRTRGMPWLLAHGANPNILHPWTGKNALHEAAGRGAADKVIASLLARGADPMRKTGEGKTAWELVPEKARGKLASLLGG